MNQIAAQRFSVTTADGLVLATGTHSVVEATRSS